MLPVKRTVPSDTPSGNYLVMLHDHVDLSSFKENLPVHIHAKIVHAKWSVVEVSGILGESFSFRLFSHLSRFFRRG